MKRVSDYVKWFCYIATSILIICAIMMPLLGAKNMPVITLFEILFSAFLTTLATVLIACKETKTRKQNFLKIALHITVLCLIMILCGYWYGWIRMNLFGIIIMVVSVAAVYLIATGFYCLIDLKQANEINQKLKEMYEEKEE